MIYVGVTESSIDTIELLERVSRLFRANVRLIEGFNTFLPPGYSIESCGRKLLLRVISDGKSVEGVLY